MALFVTESSWFSQRDNFIKALLFVSHHNTFGRHRKDLAFSLHFVITEVALVVLVLTAAIRYVLTPESPASVGS